MSYPSNALEVRTDSPFSVFSSAAAPASAFPLTLHSKEDRREIEASVLAGLAKLGYSGLGAQDLAVLLNPPDEYEREIQVMADVEAFFQISSKVFRSIIINSVSGY